MRRGEGIAIAGDEGAHAEAAIVGESVFTPDDTAALDDLHGAREAEFLGGLLEVPGGAVVGIGGEFLLRR